MHTFGSRLLQFSLSVDQLDDDNFKEFINLIEGYTKKTLGIVSTSIYLKEEKDGNHLLLRHAVDRGFREEGSPVQMVKSGSGFGFGFLQKNTTIPYTCQIAYSCMEMVPLWVISQQPRQLLSITKTKDFKDLWSNRTDLPVYNDVKHFESYPNDYEGTRTSIYIPLRKNQDKGEVIGVINFDTHDYIEITDVAKEELNKIAVAVSNVIDLLAAYKITKKNKSNTVQAISNLKEQLNLSLPQLTKPKLFLASSSQADQEAIQVIKEAVARFEERLQLIFWAELRSPGNITQQLFDTINSCRYGICYFSEPLEEGHTYQDNFNVIFEAGMFQSRINSIESLNEATWIPIREKASPEIPFDFAQERIITVPRSEDGHTLNKDEFLIHLVEAIEAMLDIS